MHAKHAIRVVIAEDDYLVSKELSRAVKKIGHEVVAEVSTGEEAIEKTCELDPDLVLMDIHWKYTMIDPLHAAGGLSERPAGELFEIIWLPLLRPSFPTSESFSRPAILPMLLHTTVCWIEVFTSLPSPFQSDLCPQKFAGF